MTQLRQGFVGQVTPLTYTMADMRILFQTAKDESLRNLLARMQAHGFPPRLPHTPGSHALWSKPAVDQWLQNWGQPIPNRHPGDVPADVSAEALAKAEAARAQAEARYQ